jgi:hypothetical protein
VIVGTWSDEPSLNTMSVARSPASKRATMPAASHPGAR